MTDYEIDTIYDYVDFLMKRGRFELLDRILQSVIDPKERDADEILTYLTATLPVKSKLNNRVYLINNLREMNLEPGLLDGLE